MGPRDAHTNGDLDDLDYLIDRMNEPRREGARTGRPLSVAFPSRPDSRQSANTHLTSHSSSRSLQAASARSHSPARSEQDTTPSLASSEWARHQRAHTAEAYYSPHHSNEERQQFGSPASTSSHPLPPLPPPSNPASPQIGSGSGSFAAPTLYNLAPPSPSAAQSSSSHSSPNGGPHSPFFVSSPSGGGGPSSPLRLLPRSPLKDRTPVEDLDFFREIEDDNRRYTSHQQQHQGYGQAYGAGSASGHGHYSMSEDDDNLSMGSGSPSLKSSTSHSRNSLRSARLRQDIERAAQKLRESASQEQIGGGSGGRVSALPLTGASPSLEQSSTTTSIHSNETRSLYSSTNSPHLARDASVRALDQAARQRPREMKEWSQACAVWQSGSPSSQSASLLQKTPLMGGLRKSAKRESAQHVLSPAEALLYGMDGPGPRKEKLTKDKSAGKTKDAAYVIGPSCATKEGAWARATSVLRDDGLLSIYSEDKVLISSVNLATLARSDIRLVDHSIFARPNCVVLHKSSLGSQTPTLGQRNPDESLYLHLPSNVAVQTWIVMSHCFAQPAFFSTQAGQFSPPAFRRSHSSNQWGRTLDDESEEDELHMMADLLNRSPKPDELSCRVFRRLIININEGRALGEHGTETFRAASKAPERRAGPVDDSLSSAMDGLGLSGTEVSPVKTRHSSKEKMDKDEGAIDSFCELTIDGDLLARTSVRKATNSPFWNESFTFTNLPAFTSPLSIKVYQTHKSTRPTLIGAASVRLADLPRSELIEEWWPVKPTAAATEFRIRQTDTLGEISLSLRVGEEIVLPEAEYQPVLDLLSDDAQGELATAIAHEFPSSLEEVTKLLVRVYQAENILIPRILKLTELEVDGNTKTAAILFRGNTILTKSVELYLRLVGTEYLEASIGEPIRKLCADKVEVEIDPSRLKPGFKEKELQSNLHTLLEWTLAIWNSIYDAREKCPNDIRTIFGHIQQTVVGKYGEEQKNTRWTSVSAFIFLRFFVPAVLNPKLFSLVREPPDPKSQRTLTLVAKTLQGLANFSSFGQKEPWMLPMNAFVQDNSAAFVDFIEHIATPSKSAAARQEWTSPTSVAYITPYRLRDGLTPLAREGIPRLPHLIDLPRDVGMLAAHIARGVADKAPLTPGPMSDTGSMPSAGSSVRSTSSASRHPKFAELADACTLLYDESRKRGGGLVGTLGSENHRVGSTPPLPRTRSATIGRPEPREPTYGRGPRSSDPAFRGQSPSTPPPRSSSSQAMLDIRNGPTSPTPEADKASRRSNRTYTLVGASPKRASSANQQSRSFSTEDLSFRGGANSIDEERPISGSFDSARPSISSEVSGEDVNDTRDRSNHRNTPGRQSIETFHTGTSICVTDEDGREQQQAQYHTPPPLTPTSEERSFSAFSAHLQSPQGASVAMQTQGSANSWASIPSSHSSTSIIADHQQSQAQFDHAAGAGRQGRRGSTPGFSFTQGLFGAGAGGEEDGDGRRRGWTGLVSARMNRKGSKGSGQGQGPP